MKYWEKVNIENSEKGVLLKGVHIKQEILFNAGIWQKDDLSLVLMKFKNCER